MSSLKPILITLAILAGGFMYLTQYGAEHPRTKEEYNAQKFLTSFQEFVEQQNEEDLPFGGKRAFPFPKPKIKNPEAYLNSTQTLEFFGYPYEVHYIVTEDGYILRYYRIQAHNTTIKKGLPPVYLQHGLLDNSDTFFINWHEKAPAFMLANEGYDVWLGNSRGNFQSMMHINMSPSDPAFWEFTFQNMSRYDLPAAFKYIVNVTEFDRIDYIGHSQGSMIMFIALAENNLEVKSRLKHFFAWGPVMFVQHQNSPIFSALAHSKFYELLEANGINNVFAYSWLNHPIMIKFCRFEPELCRAFLGPIADADPYLDNASRMDVLVGHDPGGTSLWNLGHWQQLVLNGGWRAFDYGTPELNKFHYGQTTPPEWDPLNIDIPVYLMAGSTDRLADPIDVGLLRGNISNSRQWYKSYNSGHLTFLWGNEVPQMKDVISLLQTAPYQ